MQYPSGLHIIISAFTVPTLCFLLLSCLPFPTNYIMTLMLVGSIIAYCIIKNDKRVKAELGKHDLNIFNQELSDQALESYTKEMAKTKRL